MAKDGGRIGICYTENYTESCFRKTFEARSDAILRVMTFRVSRGLKGCRNWIQLRLREGLAYLKYDSAPGTRLVMAYGLLSTATIPK